MFEKRWFFSSNGKHSVNKNNDSKTLQRAKSVDCDYSTTKPDVAGYPVVVPRKKRPKSLKLRRRTSVIIQSPPLSPSPSTAKTENDVDCNKQPVAAATSVEINGYRFNIGKVIIKGVCRQTLHWKCVSCRHFPCSHTSCFTYHFTTFYLNSFSRTYRRDLRETMD